MTLGVVIVIFLIYLSCKNKIADRKYEYHTKQDVFCVQQFCHHPGGDSSHKEKSLKEAQVETTSRKQSLKRDEGMSYKFVNGRI